MEYIEIIKKKAPHYLKKVTINLSRLVHNLTFKRLDWDNYKLTAFFVLIYPNRYLLKAMHNLNLTNILKSRIS